MRSSGPRSRNTSRGCKSAASRPTSPRSSARRPFARMCSAWRTSSRPMPRSEMRALVRSEMEAGALGIGSALIYAPGTFAKTPELIELCKEAAKHKGKYTSHVRDEGRGLVEAVEELVHIGREAGTPAQIHHIKASGKANWGLMDRVLDLVDDARSKGA